MERGRRRRGGEEEEGERHVSVVLQSSNQAIERSISLPKQAVNYVINQPMNEQKQITSHSITSLRMPGETHDRSLDQLTNKPLVQPIRLSTNQLINESIFEAVSRHDITNHHKEWVSLGNKLILRKWLGGQSADGQPA